jgi:hypothetical protein
LLTEFPVAARGRQLRHRVISRKQAILDRRAADATFDTRAASPSNVALINGNGSASTQGFTAVNTKAGADSNGQATHLNRSGATENTISELYKQFSAVRLLKRLSSAENAPQAHGALSATAMSNAVRSISGTPGRPDGHLDHSGFGGIGTSNPLNIFSTPTHMPKPEDEPFKAEMVVRLESVKRGDRIIPPCDRCRRLQMDCIKNLTACLGCTKKHAKCSWEKVRIEEISTPLNPNMGPTEAGQDSPDFHRHGQNGTDGEPKGPSANGNGFFGSDISRPGSDNTSTRTLDAASIAAVAKASAAALESTEAEQRRTQQALQDHIAHAAPIQSPNLAHSHQSPNIPSYGEYSPSHHHHHHHSTSINMPFASPQRMSTVLHGLSSADDMVYDSVRDDRDQLDIKTGDGLLHT